MAIHIKPPVFLHELGKRKNNEDSIYPLANEANQSTRLFLVCDGVGGSEKGEVASMMVCSEMPKYFEQHENEPVNQEFINKALKYAESQMSGYKLTDTNAGQMSTTLTLLYLDEKTASAVVAWAGDSRVYHIREGQILYETRDHSLVNELLKRGEITAEEALSHPQRNMILRAVSGADNPTRADVHYITDIQAGDYFVLVSDGILESVDNRILKTLLKKKNANLSYVCKQIKQMCAEYSRDNHTMYLLQIEQAYPEKTSDATDILTTKGAKTQTFETASIPTKQVTTEIEKDPDVHYESSNRKMIYALALVALAFLLGLSIFKWQEIKVEKQFLAAEKKAEQLLTQDSLQAAKVAYEDLAQGYPHKKEKINQQLTLIEERLIFQQNSQVLDSLRGIANAKIYALKAYGVDTSVLRLDTLRTYINNGALVIDSNKLKVVIDDLNRYIDIYTTERPDTNKLKLDTLPTPSNSNNDTTKQVNASSPTQQNSNRTNASNTTIINQKTLNNNKVLKNKQ